MKEKFKNEVFISGFDFAINTEDNTKCLIPYSNLGKFKILIL
jgi:hypothetical protein